MTTNTKQEVVTETAVIWIRRGMRRRNTLTSRWPVNAAPQINTTTANVVTRMPPPVEDEPAPMNISALMKTLVSLLTSGTQDTSNPADRGITAAEIARRSFMFGSSVGNRTALFHSTKTNQISEESTRNAVVASVGLVCSASAWGQDDG